MRSSSTSASSEIPLQLRGVPAVRARRFSWPCREDGVDDHFQNRKGTSSPLPLASPLASPYRSSSCGGGCKGRGGGGRGREDPFLVGIGFEGLPPLSQRHGRFISPDNFPVPTPHESNESHQNERTERRVWTPRFSRGLREEEEERLLFPDRCRCYYSSW